VGKGRVSKAILVVSGHWEEADIAVMSNPAPPRALEYGICGGFHACVPQVAMEL